MRGGYFRDRLILPWLPEPVLRRRRALANACTEYVRTGTNPAVAMTAQPAVFSPLELTHVDLAYLPYGVHVHMYVGTYINTKSMLGFTAHFLRCWIRAETPESHLVDGAGCQGGRPLAELRGNMPCVSTVVLRYLSLV